MLPVLIDEDTTDLLAVVRRKLRSWLDEEIDSEFLEALLRKQRLLVIVDRLSERQRATQDHVRTIHGSHAFHALLVTARYPLGFEAGGAVAIYPQPLGSETLLFLMTSLLQEPENRAIFPSMESQLELGRKLSRLIRVGGQEVPLTPLLVKLYVNKAIELAQREGGEEELPKSVPDVYFAYLRGVNPQGDGVINRVGDEEMLQVAELLGRQAVDKDFVPREFAKSAARTRLEAQGLGGAGKPDALQRLVSNGVLVERKRGTDDFLRFLLDPVAEFLAAMSWARRCAGSSEEWDALRDQVAQRGAQASGFATALALVCEAYAGLYGWACGATSTRHIP
jgi:hypothetical protein